MAKGPFGNPLSTGIALSGVIDMVTPVREAQERKRKRQAEEKAAEDKRAKELGSIMGKIAIDEDKIWWRYHDDARSKYANTIDKVQQMYGAGDYAGMYKTINDFDSSMANYTQATTLKNKRSEDLAKGNYYMDSNLENVSESRDVDNEEYGRLLTESGYGAYGEDRMFSYMPNAEIYDIKSSWERELKGEKQLLITEGEKAITQVGKTPSGVIAQKDYNPSVITNAHQRIRSDIYSNPYRGARILENNGYDVSSLESITDPTQRAEKTLEMFDDYIMKNRPGVDQQVLNVRADRGATGSKEKTFTEKYNISTATEKIKNPQESGLPAGTELVGKAFNPKADINSTSRGGWERLVTVSPDSYESVNGGPFRKPKSTGETVTRNMVPIGLYALKGSKDNRLFGAYRYTVKDYGIEKIFMHYEPLDPNSLTDKNNVELRDYAFDGSDDTFIKYYNEVAGLAGFSKFKGSASAAGTQSSGSSGEEEVDEFGFPIEN
jgi:hypothetical protein